MQGNPLATGVPCSFWTTMRPREQMPEFQGAQHRHEGRMEESERRATQVIGSNARDAPRGQKKHVLHEHQVLLLQARDREKEFVESQVRSELQSHIVGLEDPGMNEKFNKSECHKTENISRRNEESLLQMEELLMTSLKENSQETSDSERQAVVSTTVGDFSSKRNAAGNDSL